MLCCVVGPAQTATNMLLWQGKMAESEGLGNWCLFLDVR
jgi:hypothetical protein